ncbi:MAG: hypothetical protein ACXWT1_12615 [Methylobacter sp.]
MPLDDKGRKKRAIKAAKQLAKIRKARTLERDKNICLAYLHLSGGLMKKSDRIKAIEFLTETSGSPNLQYQQTILRKLADCTGLTRQRIHQVVNKTKK